MEVKIKTDNEMVDATIEMVDGVMVVSPIEVEEVDITQFKDGDIIACGWHTGDKSYSWVSILRGEIERITDNLFIKDYCTLNCDGSFYLENGESDSTTYVRYATEEEKKKLFDKLKEEGYEFDFEKKVLVKLKWKPKDHEKVYVAGFTFYNENSFCPFEDTVYSGSAQWRAAEKRGWYFQTEEECQEFCNRLNKSISSIKP